MDAYEEYLLRKQQGLPNGSQLGDGYSPASAAAAPISTAGQVAESVPFPGVQAAGLGIDTIGKIVGAYGAYQDAQDAKAQQDKTQTHDWARQANIDTGNEQDRQRQGAIQSGNYADQMLEEILKNYGGYNSRIGR